MLPRPRASMCGSTAWQQKKTPSTLTRNVARQSASGELGDRAEPAEAGVVDQEVDGAERLERLRHHAVGGLAIADVGDDGGGAARRPPRPPVRPERRGPARRR